MISQKSTNMQDAIPPQLKLAATLRFLSTGDSYTSLQFQLQTRRSTWSVYNSCLLGNLQQFSFLYSI